MVILIINMSSLHSGSEAMDKQEDEPCPISSVESDIKTENFVAQGKIFFTTYLFKVHFRNLIYLKMGIYQII